MDAAIAKRQESCGARWNARMDAKLFRSLRGRFRPRQYVLGQMSAEPLTLGCPDISDLSDPLPVRDGRMELPVENIRGNGTHHALARVRKTFSIARLRSRRALVGN